MLAVVESNNNGTSPGGWQKHFSKTHQTHYWHNTANGRTSWVEPITKDEDECAHKRRRIEGTTPQANHSTTMINYRDVVLVPTVEDRASTTKTEPSIAIIVPYRDLHKEQSRRQQLDLFIPSITKFMELDTEDESSYRIYVIEQSNDERKFNRGKLLNIGFQIACSEGCKALIFHDVDLIPSPELRDFYYEVPEEKPIHIARVWDRYSVNEGYFGGITSFSEKQFRDINGFPNNFWGWGGEDDELYKRTKLAGIVSTFPRVGSITDMENMNLKNKLQFLRDHKIWKCMNKTEVLEEHSSSWMRNGLSSLDYKELSRTELSTVAVKITVDVCLNKHWTDLVCGVENTQLSESVDSLKARFNGSTPISVKRRT